MPPVIHARDTEFDSARPRHARDDRDAVTLVDAAIMRPRRIGGYPPTRLQEMVVAGADEPHVGDSQSGEADRPTEIV